VIARLLLLAAILPASALAQQPADTQEQSTFRAQTVMHAVHLLPRLTRDDGRPVFVKKEDLSLHAYVKNPGEKGIGDQVPVEAAYFEMERERPMDFVVLVGTGYWMNKYWHAVGNARDAVRVMIPSLRPGDRMMIASYAAGLNILQPLTDDKRLLDKAADSIRSSSEREQSVPAVGKFIDYVKPLLAKPEAQNRFMTILIYADGRTDCCGGDGPDGFSVNAPARVISRLAGMDVPVISITPEFRTHEGGGGPDENIEYPLNTGGIVAFANDMTPKGEPVRWHERREVLKDLAELSRKRYLLAYAPAAKPGQAEELSLFIPDWRVTSGADAWAHWGFLPLDPEAFTDAKILGYKFLK
jgi:hypothetical protein